MMAFEQLQYYNPNFTGQKLKVELSKSKSIGTKMKLIILLGFIL